MLAWRPATQSSWATWRPARSAAEAIESAWSTPGDVKLVAREKSVPVWWKVLLVEPCWPGQAPVASVYQPAPVLGGKPWVRPLRPWTPRRFSSRRLGMAPPAANRSTRSGRMPSAENRIAGCSAGGAAAAATDARAGAAVASSAPRTERTRRRPETRREKRRRAAMNTFLKPALGAGGGAEPGDAVTLPYRANTVKISRTDWGMARSADLRGAPRAGNRRRPRPAGRLPGARVPGRQPDQPRPPGRDPDRRARAVAARRPRCRRLPRPPGPAARLAPPGHRGRGRGLGGGRVRPVRGHHRSR